MELMVRITLQYNMECVTNVQPEQSLVIIPRFFKELVFLTLMKLSRLANHVPRQN